MIQYSCVPQKAKNNRTIVYMVCVFTIAVTFYLISFSGVPISDDEELFASMARNLAVSGKFSAEQLYGNLRLMGNYNGVEPFFSTLASIWYHLLLHIPIGHLQIFYILPILYTGASAALIVLIAAQLNYSPIIGVTAGLLYSLSTMAWPYAKTFFREPLISLLLLCSLSIFISLVTKRHGLLSRFWREAVLLSLLALLFLTKVVMIITAFGLLITFIFLKSKNKANKKQGISLIVVCCLVILTGLSLYFLSPKTTDSNVFYRFSSTFFHDAIGRLTSISHSHFVEALTAPLVSPWKGLLFYSPVCILGVVSLFKYGRQKVELFILPILVTIALLLNQALAYDNQWWTPTWGSRFLLPVIPLIIVSSLPVIEELINKRKGQVILGLLFAIGFLIQLPAVLFNSAEFTSTAVNSDKLFPADYIWNLSKTPIITQWQAVVHQQPDLLLWRTANIRPFLALIIISIVLCLLLTTLIYLRKVINNPVTRIPGWLFLGYSITFIALITGLVLVIGISDPSYHRQDLQPMCSFIRSNIKQEDIIIIQPYPGPVWKFLMNFDCGQGIWYSLAYNDETTFNQSEVNLVNKLTAQDSRSRLWFIDQFWANNYLSSNGGLTTNNYRLSEERYFLGSINIFVGLYTNK